MINDSYKEILKHKRKAELERTSPRINDSRSTRKCTNCNERHHTSIFWKQSEPLQKEPSLHITNGPVAHQTVQAKIGGILCRALLDSAFIHSFIHYLSKEHARKLDVEPC